MTRKRVTASAKKQRHEWAVRQIDAGMGLSELTAFTAETWGCSGRNARDVVAAAHKDWFDACYGSEEIDQRDLLFQQVGRLERIARKAENAGQFSAAVGAITALTRRGFEVTGRIPAGIDLDSLVDVAHRPQAEIQRTCSHRYQAFTSVLRGAA